MSDIQGAPKNVTPWKNSISLVLYQIVSNFFRQIYTAYTRGFRPHIVQISLQYLVAFKNYNYLTLSVHFSKWTSN